MLINILNKLSFQDINDSNGTRLNNNYDVSPWLVSSDTVQATKGKEQPIIRKSVLTTQL